MRSGKVVLLLFLISLGFLGSSFLEGLRSEREMVVRVVEVDNSRLINRGTSSVGTQQVRVEGGSGKTFWCVNFVNGDKEIDEIYEVGERVVVGVKSSDGEVLEGRVLSAYRLPYLKVLFLIFSGALLLYSGGMGIRSLISFFASIYLLCRYMVPHILRGGSPFYTTILTLVLLTSVIIFSVGGVGRRGVAAFSGTVVGLGISIALTSLFSSYLKLDGFTMPMSQSLLASGNFSLNFREIFYSSIILSASGAAMDIAMDMAASLEEIKEANPSLTPRELLRSSFNIGNAVVGTMSTTLLLAYTGGNITMMMFLLDRGVSIYAILNGKFMAAEIMRTLIGTTSLIIVAPTTAVLSIGIYDFSERRRVGRKLTPPRAV
ncbi:membrane protein [Propionigenium maris DSM 9537]|uniref:Membrane protein n=1 Tax=Propionigenium maris DSM 9537 TaxID=1123000 RepID=A0A9W6GL16_9FUSO|nr:YibE/F family protein [Propionigenium maris]GLI56308.1 membrane protein [Propionigenium maris DSM 9537]